MTNKNCRDSFTDLMNMSFADFADLENLLYIKSLYEEEIEDNKEQLAKRK